MIHIVPTLQDNYTYIVEANGEALIVDCGEAQPVINLLDEKNLKPVVLLCTHHHGDHIDGIAKLKEKFQDLKIHAAAKDRARIQIADQDLNSGHVFQWNNLDFLPIETPGHTLPHLCFYVAQLQVVFTGDTLFSMGCGRLFEGTPADMFASLAKLKALPDDTKIYGGHEYTLKNGEFALSVKANEAIEQRVKDVNLLRIRDKPSFPVSLETEKKTNLFLRAKTVEEFAQLRELRNHF